MQQWSRGTKYSISSYDSRWFEQIRCILEVLNFFTIDIPNGEVTKLTLPKVTDIKNLKYTNCRHLCPYCAMRVSKSSDHWCAFGKMSNFEKRSLRSGHLMRPGHVTFGVIGSSFFRKWSNCWLNSYGKFGGATRRRFFFRYLRKTVRGGWNQPPPVRELRFVYCLLTLARKRCFATFAGVGGGGCDTLLAFPNEAS